MRLGLKLDGNIFYYDEHRNVYDNRHNLFANPYASIKRFYYYDHQFSQVAWNKEPPEDLWTLYSRRAQQIRDDYEYVVLCYSGGVDSTTILEAFYYNNIHIDEILVVGAFSQDKFEGDDTNHNGDIYYNVYPTLKTMDLPNTKITIKDYTDYFVDPNNFSLIKEYGDDFTLFLGSYTSVHNLFWYDLKKFIAPPDKKACYIMGSDKPRLSYHTVNGRFFTQINDNAVTDYGAAMFDENLTRVNFYTHPDAQEIMRKQLHLMMKYYVQYVLVDRKISHEDYDKHYIAIADSVVYNLRNPLQFKSKKSSIACLSLRDTFILDKQDSKMFQLYKDSLARLDKNIATPRTGFRTKAYYLTE
jgi:hypothetical protein